ncbi:cobaltochelatase CobT-related protein [Ectothiorhodospira shaposhnikovii]|uniref:cobaltochelatase CobT-related protein n=1 Tax=Ectothiorhodospira shaposhnikovii TaxID=1054 RepID=UPI001EE8213B|nr:hypothetical protein [Ectothiorhodospira shaposhnikovii]MCG5512776.1 hypothetical protein [Ectothiorhodospira shaposhnikovii]
MAEVKDIIAIREAMKNITQILAEKDLKVTQQGSRAYVMANEVTCEPYRVNLPYIPDNASDELLAAIQGFLDHEVAHVLFTDWKVVRKARSKGGRVAEIHNVVEDTFIERMMCQRFRGSAMNLDRVGSFYIQKFVQPKLSEALESGDRGKVFSVIIVSAMRAWAGHSVFQDFMRDKWHLLDKVPELLGEEVIERVAKIKSSQEALELAEEIVKRLSPPKSEKSTEKEGKSEEAPKKCKGEKSAPKPPEPKEDEEEKPEEGESEEGESEEGEDEEEKPEEGESESEEGEGESEEGESEDEEGEGEGESEEGEDEEGEGEGEGEGESEEGEDEEGEGGEGSESEDDGVRESERKRLIEQISEALDAVAGSDFDEATSKAISEDMIRAHTDSDYLPFTRDNDIIEPFELDGGWQDDYLKQMDDATSAMVGTLQKNMERLIVAKTQAGWQPGMRSGSVNAASLYRLRTGDTRVFRKRQESQKIETAVSLVVDCSGSMSDGPINLAAISAYAMCSVLDRIGVPNEVIGFTTKPPLRDLGKEIEKESEEVGKRIEYSRFEGIYMPIFKSFNERLSLEQRRRIAYMPHKPFLRNNIDGESVEYAAMRLLSRREPGKVMFVLSDGYPAAYGDTSAMRRHLKKTVKKIEAAGVKMMGIGIMSNSVKDFYGHYAVLNDINELPTRIMQELRSVLL